MTWLTCLLSRDESAADSIVLGALLALLTLDGVTVYAAIESLASWSPVTFATASATVIGAAAAAKTARDRLAVAPTSPTQGSSQ